MSNTLVSKKKESNWEITYEKSLAHPPNRSPPPSTQLLPCIQISNL